jgi:hypothetical protein
MNGVCLRFVQLAHIQLKLSCMNRIIADEAVVQFMLNILAIPINR